MNVVLIFDKRQKCTTGWYVYKELVKANINVTVFSSNEVGTVSNIDADLILAVDDSSHYILDVNFYPKAIWLIDTHLSFICDKIMAESFDFIFVAQKDGYEKLKRKFQFVYWLPLAADLEYHGRRNLSIRYDVSFVGNLGLGRRRLLMTELSIRYPNSYIGQADCAKIGEIYSASKIVVNYSIKNDINMRIFEAMCSGSLLVTNWIDNGLDELFDIGNDLVTYDNSIEDLIDKINYYLKHEDERSRISMNGFRKIINAHTYRHRIEFILKRIEENRKINVFLSAKKNFKLLKLRLWFSEVILFFVRGVTTKTEKVLTCSLLKLRSLSKKLRKK